MKMDYEKLGLKVGIEIHQQLKGKKLFCNCPAEIADGKPDYTVKRRLRAVIGETGEVDTAAGFEQTRSKEFVYLGHDATSCLVELDEEPPGLLNPDALYTVLQVAKTIGAAVVDEVQVMRKTVVDGSNTTGFQRTSLVARNGMVESSMGTVRVPTICIEEDACKKVKSEGDTVFFDLSRLGIPLIEIATEPDIFDPVQAQEVSAYLGMVLRSTKRVKRGLGTIRQDVNVSIAGGNRVEIKGAQDLRMIPTLIENEVRRQKGLLEIKDELVKRGVSNVFADSVVLTGVFSDLEKGFVKKIVESGGAVVGIRMSGFAGILGKELMPGYRFGTELKDLAMTMGVKGIIHSDEDLSKYYFTDAHADAVRNLLGVQDGDAFALCVGEEDRLRILFSELIVPRLSQALVGVPKEVRNAAPDGTTSFLRPMPGAARMYPETDALPVRVSLDNVAVPKLLSEIENEYCEKYLLSEELAHDIAGLDFDFERFATSFENLKPSFVAETMVGLPKTIKRKSRIDVVLNEEQWFELFMYLDKGVISKDSLLDFLMEVPERSIPAIVEDFRLVGEDELRSAVEEIVRNNPGAARGALIGMVMGRFKGRADGKKVNQILNDFF